MPKQNSLVVLRDRHKNSEILGRVFLNLFVVVDKNHNISFCIHIVLKPRVRVRFRVPTPLSSPSPESCGSSPSPSYESLQQIKQHEKTLYILM